MKKNQGIIALIVVIIIVVIIILATNGSKKEDTSTAVVTDDTTVVDEDDNADDNNDGGSLYEFDSITAKIQGQWKIEGTEETWIHVRDFAVTWVPSGDYYPWTLEGNTWTIDKGNEVVEYTLELNDAASLMDRSINLTDAEGTTMLLVR